MSGNRTPKRLKSLIPIAVCALIFSGCHSPSNNIEASGLPVPAYPRDAVLNHWSGKVILEVTLGTNSIPDSVTIKKTSGHAILDDAAIKAFKNWNFRTTQIGKFAVKLPFETNENGIMTVPVEFHVDRETGYP